MSHGQEGARRGVQKIRIHTTCTSAEKRRKQAKLTIQQGNIAPNRIVATLPYLSSNQGRSVVKFGKIGLMMGRGGY